MKRVILFMTVLVLGLNLISCSALRALSYSISGDIIDPMGDFSYGSEDGRLFFGGCNYILLDELAGEFEIDITDDDLLLGQISNFPFFPNFGYYANAAENADYILSGAISGNTATVVYLREDLYQSPLRYMLLDAEYEFEFTSAFIATEDVSYETHIEGAETRGTVIYFGLRDVPRLTVAFRITHINEKWYYVKQECAVELSEEFLSVLVENDIPDSAN